MSIEDLIKTLLEADNPPSARALIEASVHLGTRSKTFTASFHSPGGGQTWKSTGLTDREAALRLARSWEEEARRKGVAASSPHKRPTIRVRPGSAEKQLGLLSQAEVAAVMQLSTRAVRRIQAQALRKLFHHPELRALWKEYMTGEVEESDPGPRPGSDLIRAEIAALFALTQTPMEWQALSKLISFMGGHGA